jgi:hypothetical protein
MDAILSLCLSEGRIEISNIWKLYSLDNPLTEMFREGEMQNLYFVPCFVGLIELSVWQGRAA